MELPNPDTRPEGEVRELERIWATPRGWRLVTAVNNTVIGLLYIGVAFLFFLMAGLLAVVTPALSTAAPSGDDSVTPSQQTALDLGFQVAPKEEDAAERSG